VADHSFDIHPKTKGSYRRRAEDIDRVLRNLRLEGLSREATLLIYYFACEKLAKIIIGVSTKKPASNYFEKNYSLRINNIKLSCKKLGTPVSEEDIDWIFTSACDGPKWKLFLSSAPDTWILSSLKSPKSARWLRNKMVHDIGPTHAKLTRQHAMLLNRKMKKFLSLSTAVVRYLEVGHKTGS